MILPENSGSEVADSEYLLRAVAEQLKMPLLQISQQAELIRNGHDVAISQIETIADMALHLVESYILSNNAGQQRLELEPVSVSAVLHAAAEKLSPIAKEYSCDIQLHLNGKYGPVLANRRRLEAAMVSLGYSFIEAQLQHGVKKPRIVLAAHRSRQGIVSGAFGDSTELTSDMLRRAKYLRGRSKQSLPSISHAQGAGVFVADSLLSSMSSQLKVSRHSRLTGLAATLPPNPQLRLV